MTLSHELRKMAQPLEMPFVLWTGVSQRKHVMPNVASWRTRLNCPCPGGPNEEAVKLLWTICLRVFTNHTAVCCASFVTMNDRLSITFKSICTVNWDPQPTVAKFLTIKDRRKTVRDSNTYKKREFQVNTA